MSAVERDLVDTGPWGFCCQKTDDIYVYILLTSSRPEFPRQEFVRAECTRPECAIFVGDITPEVDDFLLFDYFYKRYPSCIDCKVATDLLGYSR